MKNLNRSNSTESCQESISDEEDPEDKQHRELYGALAGQAEEEAEMLLHEAWKMFNAKFRPLLDEVNQKLRVFKSEFKVLKKLLKVFVFLPTLVFIYLVVAIVCNFLQADQMFIPALRPGYVLLFVTDLFFFVTIQSLVKMYFLQQNIEFINPLFDANLPGPLCLLTHSEFFMFISEDLTSLWAMLFFLFYPGMFFYGLTLLTHFWFSGSWFSRLSKDNVAFHQRLRQFTDKNCTSIKARKHVLWGGVAKNTFFYECPKVVEVDKVLDEDDQTIFQKDYKPFNFFREAIPFQLRCIDDRIVVAEANVDGTCCPEKAIQVETIQDLKEPYYGGDKRWKFEDPLTGITHGDDAGAWRLWTLVENQDPKGKLDGTYALRTFTVKGEGDDLKPGCYLSVNLRGQISLSDEIHEEDERFYLKVFGDEPVNRYYTRISLCSVACKKYLKPTGNKLTLSTDNEAQFRFVAASPKMQFDFIAPKLSPDDKSDRTLSSVDLSTPYAWRALSEKTKDDEVAIRLLECELPGAPGTTDAFFKDTKLRDIQLTLQSRGGFKRCGLVLSVRLCRGERVVKADINLKMPTQEANDLQNTEERLDLLKGLWRDRLLEDIKSIQEKEMNVDLRASRAKFKSERDRDRMQRKRTAILERQEEERDRLDCDYGEGKYKPAAPPDLEERIKAIERERDRKLETENKLWESNLQSFDHRENDGFEHPCGCGPGRQPCSICGVCPCFCESGKCACGAERCVFPCKPSTYNCAWTQQTHDDKLKMERQLSEEEKRHAEEERKIHAEFDRQRQELEEEEAAASNQVEKHEEYKEKLRAMTNEHETASKDWDYSNADNHDLIDWQHVELEKMKEEYNIVEFRTGCLVYDKWDVRKDEEPGFSKVHCAFTLQVSKFHKKDDLVKYKKQTAKARNLMEAAINNPRNLQEAIQETLDRKGGTEALKKTIVHGSTIVWLSFAEEENWQMPVPDIPPEGPEGEDRAVRFSMKSAPLINPPKCRWLTQGCSSPSWLWGGFCCGGPVQWGSCSFCWPCAVVHWGWAGARGKHLIQVALPGDNLEIWLRGKSQPNEGYFSQCCGLSQENRQWNADLAVKAKFELQESEDRYSKPEKVDMLVTRSSASEDDVTKKNYLAALTRFPDMHVGTPKLGDMSLVGTYQVKLTNKILLREMPHIAPKVPLKVPLAHLDFPHRDYWRYFYVKDLSNQVTPTIRKFIERVVLGTVFGVILWQENLNEKGAGERAEVSWLFLFLLLGFQIAQVCETLLLDEQHKAMAAWIAGSLYGSSFLPGSSTLRVAIDKVFTRATFFLFILLMVLVLFISFKSAASFPDILNLTIQVTVMLVIYQLVNDSIMEGRFKAGSFLDIGQCCLLLVIVSRNLLPATSDVNASITMILWVLWVLLLLNSKFYYWLFMGRMQQLKEYTDDVEDSQGTCMEKFKVYMSRQTRKKVRSAQLWYMKLSDHGYYALAYMRLHTVLILQVLLVFLVVALMGWYYEFVFQPIRDFLKTHISWLKWTYCGGNIGPVRLATLFVVVFGVWCFAWKKHGRHAALAHLLISVTIGLAIGKTAPDGATVGVPVCVLIAIIMVLGGAVIGVVPSTAVGIFAGVFFGFALGGQYVAIAVIIAVGVVAAIFIVPEKLEYVCKFCYDKRADPKNYPYYMGPDADKEVDELLKSCQVGRPVAPFPGDGKILANRKMLCCLNIEHAMPDMQAMNTFVDDKGLCMESVMKRKRGIEFCPLARKVVLTTPLAATCPRKLSLNTPLQVSEPRFNLLSKVTKKPKEIVTTFLLPDLDDELVCTIQIVNLLGLETGMTDRHDGVLSLWRSQGVLKPIQLARWFEETVRFFADYGADFSHSQDYKPGESGNKSNSNVFCVMEALFYNQDHKIGQRGSERCARNVRKLAPGGGEGEGFLDVEEEFQEILVRASDYSAPALKYQGSYDGPGGEMNLRMNSLGQLEFKSNEEGGRDYVVELTPDPAVIKLLSKWNPNFIAEGEVSFQDSEPPDVKQIKIDDAVFTKKEKLKPRPSYLAAEGIGILTEALICAPVEPVLLHVVLAEHDLHADDTTRLPYTMLRQERAEQMQHAFSGCWLSETTTAARTSSIVKYDIEKDVEGYKVESEAQTEVEEFSQWSGYTCSMKLRGDPKTRFGQLTLAGQLQWDDGTMWVMRDVVFGIGADKRLYKQARNSVGARSPWRPSGKGFFQSVATYCEDVYVVEHNTEGKEGRILTQKMAYVSPMSDWKPTGFKASAICVNKHTLYMVKDDGVFSLSLGRALEGQRENRIADWKIAAVGEAPGFGVMNGTVYATHKGVLVKGVKMEEVNSSRLGMTRRSTGIVSVAFGEDDMIYVVGTDTKVYRQDFKNMSTNSSWSEYTRGGMMSIAMPQTDQRGLSAKASDKVGAARDRAVNTLAAGAATISNAGQGVFSWLSTWAGGSSATEAQPRDAAVTENQASHGEMPPAFVMGEELMTRQSRTPLLECGGGREEVELPVLHQQESRETQDTFPNYNLLPPLLAGRGESSYTSTDLIRTAAQQPLQFGASDPRSMDIMEHLEEGTEHSSSVAVVPPRSQRVLGAISKNLPRRFFRDRDGYTAIQISQATQRGV